MKDVYYDLMDSINMRGGTVAAHKCDECYDLMAEIFTPEEAAMFIKLPLSPSTADQIAEQAGKPVEETVAILEKMADKGQIVTRDKAVGRVYAAIPLVPGIFEFQLTGGGETERDYKLAKLFDVYFKKVEAMPQDQKLFPKVPFARVIPVEEDVKKRDIEVHPYETISEYIEKAKTRANQLINDGKKKSETLVADAKEKVDALLKEAEKVLKEAKVKAGDYVKDGKTKVEKEGDKLKSAIKAGIDTYKSEKES